MIDRYLLPLARPLLTPAARALDRRGVRADQVTLAGFGLGVLAFGALAIGWSLAALVLIAGNRVGDGIDGVMARIQGPTDRGAYLDIALDFQFYALVPLGFAIADPAANALAAAVLLACFMGTGSSFLAHAIFAERQRVPSVVPNKGFFYIGGLAEGGETILAFALMCLFPASFPLIAYVFATACAATVIGRMMAGWASFGPQP